MSRKLVDLMKKAIAYVWGSTAEERLREFPCDQHIINSDDVYFRAISVEASASTLFRWLCQLKIAAYSYDWIGTFENIFLERTFRWHKSPKKLTSGIENLACGQKIMDIFKIIGFEKNRSLTIEMEYPKAISTFGYVVGSYMIIPVTESSCRLVVKMHVIYPKETVWSWMRWFLPWADMFMLSKQLITFKKLSEKR